MPDQGNGGAIRKDLEWLHDDIIELKESIKGLGDKFDKQATEVCPAKREVIYKRLTIVERLAAVTNSNTKYQWGMLVVVVGAIVGMAAKVIWG